MKGVRVAIWPQGNVFHGFTSLVPFWNLYWLELGVILGVLWEVGEGGVEFLLSCYTSWFVE